MSKFQWSDPFLLEEQLSLEEKMKLAQNISTLTLSLRKKEKIRSNKNC